MPASGSTGWNRSRLRGEGVEQVAPGGDGRRRSEGAFVVLGEDRQRSTAP